MFDLNIGFLNKEGNDLTVLDQCFDFLKYRITRRKLLTNKYNVCFSVDFFEITRKQFIE